MKLLITTPTYYPDNNGLANSIYNHKSMLERMGHNVIIATSHNKLRSISENNTISFKIKGSLNIFNQIRGDQDEYLHWVVGEGFDLIICEAWHCWSSEILLLNKQEINCPIILYSHGTAERIIYQDMLLYSIIRALGYLPYFLLRDKLDHAIDGLIVLSSAGEESRFHDFERLSRHQKPVYIIPNEAKIDSHIFSNSPNNELNSNDKGFILSVGSFVKEKGHDRVIKAYAKSPAFNRIPLILCGQDKTPYLKALKLLSKKLDIAQSMISFKVGYSGYKLFKLYEECSFFAYGSRTECQPLVIIDAHLACKPFVSFDVGDLRFRRSGLVASCQKQFNNYFSSLCNQTVLNSLKSFCMIDLECHKSVNIYKSLTQVLKDFSS